MTEKSEGPGAVEIRPEAQECSFDKLNHIRDCKDDQRGCDWNALNDIPTVAPTFFPDFCDLVVAPDPAMTVKLEGAVAPELLGYILALPLADLLVAAKVRFDGRFFRLDEEGVPALLLPCVNEQNQIDDYVAFELAGRMRVATWCGKAWCIGVSNVFLSNAFGAALVVAPTIPDWLKWGGEGVCILNVARTLRELQDRGIHRLAVRSRRERVALKRVIDRAQRRLTPNITVLEEGA